VRYSGPDPGELRGTGAIVADSPLVGVLLDGVCAGRCSVTESVPDRLNRARGGTPTPFVLALCGIGRPLRMSLSHRQVPGRQFPGRIETRPTEQDVTSFPH
jgi:hypothetical protein